MRKIVTLALTGLSLAGCAVDTRRTYPAIVVEERPIGTVYYERAPILVPPHREYLPEPRYNFVEQRPVPMPVPRPYNLTQPPARHACDPRTDVHHCRSPR